MKNQPFFQFMDANLDAPFRCGPEGKSGEFVLQPSEEQSGGDGAADPDLAPHEAECLNLRFFNVVAELLLQQKRRWPRFFPNRKILIFDNAKTFSRCYYFSHKKSIA